MLVNLVGVYCSDLEKNLKKVFKTPRYVEKVDTFTVDKGENCLPFFTVD